MKLIIKNGRVIDPEKKIDKYLDILIENNKIKMLAKDIKIDNVEYIDAESKIVAPGLIDTDFHCYNHSFPDIESLEYISEVALNGGFTSVAIMPDTYKKIDNPEIIIEILEKVKKNCFFNFFIISSITKNMLGEELCRMQRIKDLGIVAFSDVDTIRNTEILRTAFQYAKNFNKSFLVSCEDTFLVQNGCVNEGFVSTVLGLKGRPGIAEAIIIFRDVLLAIESKVPIHILNVTCDYSIDATKYLKSKYNKLTAGICHDYFCLSENDCLGFNTNMKIQPPLRSMNNVNLVKKALKDGTIDIIASGHRPRDFDEKNDVFSEATIGSIGIELTFPLVITELVRPGFLSLNEAISKMTINPAKLLGIKKGSLNVGMDADIIIFDINKKWKVTEKTFDSGYKNSPYINKEVYGLVEKVILGGKIVRDRYQELNIFK